jgi:hypothetical protein
MFAPVQPQGVLKLAVELNLRDNAKVLPLQLLSQQAHAFLEP